jgi:hypothetical protein
MSSDQVLFFYVGLAGDCFEAQRAAAERHTKPVTL